MKKFSVFLMSLVLPLLLFLQPADASFIMYLNDMSSPSVIEAIIQDNAAASTSTSIGNTTDADLSSTLGVINFNGPVGAFSVNVTTGISKPVIGGPDVAKMDLNSVNISGGAGVLQIWLTDTDFVLTGQDVFNLVLTNAWGGTTNGQVIAQGWLDPNNGEFVMGAYTTGLQGPLGPGAFADTAIAGVPLGSLAAGQPFSLTEAVQVTHTAASQITSFDKELTTAVPEPATLLLIGSGLVGLGALRRKRFFKKS